MPENTATRILIVDDEELIRGTLVRILEPRGYECVTAADATEARIRLRSEEPELILCDVRMPGEPGQGAVELFVVGSVVGHRTAVLVDDRDHPVHVRVLVQNAEGPDPLRHVLAGRGRAVDGADDGDVVARAVAAVAAVITEKSPRTIGEPSGVSRRVLSLPRRGCISKPGARGAAPHPRSPSPRIVLEPRRGSITPPGSGVIQPRWG